MTPIVVLSSIRSRSYWLSCFLGCPHEPSTDWKDWDDARAQLVQDKVIVDTGLVFLVDRLKKEIPEVILVGLRRPMEHIARSVKAKGREPNFPAMALADATIAAIQPTYWSSSLDSVAECARLYEMIRGETMPFQALQWMGKKVENPRTEELFDWQVPEKSVYRELL